MLTKTQIANDPIREENLTRRLAVMIAQGAKTDKEIARDLGIAPSLLTHLKNSPLFRKVISTFNDEITERGLQSVVEDLASDAPKNISFIKKVRDGHFYDKKDRMQVRMSAAFKLLDKQVPNADSAAAMESAAKLVINGRLMGQVLRALRNSDVIDITDADIQDATGQGLPKIMAVTPEDYQERFNAADEQDDDAS